MSLEFGKNQISIDCRAKTSVTAIIYLLDSKRLSVTGKHKFI